MESVPEGAQAEKTVSANKHNRTFFILNHYKGKKGKGKGEVFINLSGENGPWGIKHGNQFLFFSSQSRQGTQSTQSCNPQIPNFQQDSLYKQQILSEELVIPWRAWRIFAVFARNLFRKCIEN